MYSESEWLCEQPYVLTYSDCVPGMGSEEVPQSASVVHGGGGADEGLTPRRTAAARAGRGSEVATAPRSSMSSMELRKRQRAATEVSASPASKA